MSPTMCSHSGFSVRDSLSIGSETSVSVQANRRLRWLALFPPPEPSSSSVRSSPSPAASASRTISAASSA